MSWSAKEEIAVPANTSRDEQWHKWAELTEKYGDRCHIVADDIATTSARLVRPLIREKIANNLLFKLNQIGSLMEGWRAARTAHAAGWYTTSSHRSQSGMDTMEVEVHLALAIPKEVRNLFGKWGGANLIERANRYLFEQLAVDEFAGGAQSFHPIDPSRKIRIAMPLRPRLILESKPWGCASYSMTGGCSSLWFPQVPLQERRRLQSCPWTRPSRLRGRSSANSD